MKEIRAFSLLAPLDHGWDQRIAVAYVRCPGPVDLINEAFHHCLKIPATAQWAEQKWRAVAELTSFLSSAPLQGMGKIAWTEVWLDERRPLNGDAEKRGWKKQELGQWGKRGGRSGGARLEWANLPLLSPASVDISPQWPRLKWAF